MLKCATSYASKPASQPMSTRLLHLVADDSTNKQLGDPVFKPRAATGHVSQALREATSVVHPRRTRDFVQHLQHICSHTATDQSYDMHRILLSKYERPRRVALRLAQGRYSRGVPSHVRTRWCMSRTKRGARSALIGRTTWPGQHLRLSHLYACTHVVQVTTRTAPCLS